MAGDGGLEFYGNNRLVLAGDMTTAVMVQLKENSQAMGTGLLTLQSNQTLSGVFNVPVALATGASAVMTGATFNEPVEIAGGVNVGVSGAVFKDTLTVQTNSLVYLSYNTVMTINAGLTNLGTLQFYSRDVNTYWAERVGSRTAG